MKNYKYYLFIFINETNRYKQISNVSIYKKYNQYI